MVYLLHIDPPYGRNRHYIGVTRRGMRRVYDHMRGRGSLATQRAIKAGCKISFVCSWDNVDFKFEKYVKRRFRKKICPWCSGCPTDFLRRI